MVCIFNQPNQGKIVKLLTTKVLGKYYQTKSKIVNTCKLVLKETNAE